jgi:microcystin-dependent protein
MPSTYSPDLRIELIANGEQSGTWGTTTNTNLGTLIEDAIAGLASVSVTTANQALTAVNGGADQARCAAVSLTTTTTAAFNVYVPPVTKLYVVRNASAYVATIYCSTVLGNTTAAGDGVAIPAGKSVLLRSDGTNIVEQLNHITGGFSIGGAATFSGAVTFGSTATLNADPTLALQAATKQYVDAAASGSSPSGALIMWPTGTAPSGWLLCNGAAVSRTTYAALFAVIGTTFGAGDTTTTFNLPDYRDKMPIGVNTIAASIGATGGSKDAIVVTHTHTASANTVDGHQHAQGYAAYSIAPGARYGIRTGLPSYTVSDSYGTSTNIPTAGALTSTDGGHTHSITVDATGSSGTNANMPPYIGINFIIKT